MGIKIKPKNTEKIVKIDEIDQNNEEAIIADFRRIFDEFADEDYFPYHVFARALYFAAPAINEKYFGKFDINNNYKGSKMALYYLMAHSVFVAYGGHETEYDKYDPTNIRQAAQMNPASKSVGDEAINYRIQKIQKATDDWLSLSYYGTQFLFIRERLPRSGFTTGESMNTQFVDIYSYFNLPWRY